MRKLLYSLWCKTAKGHAALATAQDYVEAICEEDISRADGVSRNPDKARALLRSYARNIATQASDATLREDMSPTGETLSQPSLSRYLDALGGHVFHYRDKSGLEADAVIVLDDGGLVEVKLGDAYVDEGAKNLRLLADKIDQQTMGNPAFLAVVTAGGYAYTRGDGVHVVPIGCLKP